MLWGRLLYDPVTPDSVFASAFNNRYHIKSGNDLFEAYTAASQMPLDLASFYRATWDYTLYSEGFLAPYASGGMHDTVSSFISIEELIDHPVPGPGLSLHPRIRKPGATKESNRPAENDST